MIQLYGRDERDFQGHNGRVLAAVSNDTITWKVNEQFDFQFDYPLFAKHGLAIENEMIVTAPVPGYDDQAFRINSVEKSMGMLTVHAYHVFWDLMQNFVEDINIVNKEGADAVAHVLESTQFPHEFTATSTVGNIASARIVRMSVIAALIGTDDNTVLSRWGGEFEWDNFHFNHVAKLGEDRGVVFRNGKNLLGYKATEDLTNTVTRIMPEGYNGLFLPELYVDSSLIDNYATPRIAKISYTDIKAIDEESVSADGETDPDALPMDQALDALRAAAKREYELNEVDKPGLEFELNVVMLEDTEEYRGRGIFSRVYPGDTARFIHDEDGLDVKARMTGYTWQPSTEQYLTQSYYSSSALRGGTDVEHKIEQIGNQITVIDKTVTMKAANNSNTVGWSSDTPPDEPKNAKEGDLWYQQVGNHVIMWMWHDSAWIETASDISGHDASNLIEGTFNAATVNVINLNGNSIVSRSISADKLVANSITANEIQAGAITADKIQAGSITGDKIRAGSITADKLAVGSILVALNGELSSMRLTTSSITMSTGGQVTMQLDSSGMYVSNGNEQVGYIHANQWASNSSVKGLAFNLLPNGDYMTWGQQQTSGGTFYAKMLWMSSSASSASGSLAGFSFNDKATFQQPVTFNGGTITFQGTLKIPNSGAGLTIGTNTLGGNIYPSIMRDNWATGISFGSGELYLITHNTYYPFKNVVDVTSPLHGKSLSIPSSMNSNGTAAQWYNFTFS